MNAAYKYGILALDIFATAAFMTLALRAIASTIVLETIGVVNTNTTAQVKRKVSGLVIKAFVFILVAVIFFLLSIQSSLAGFVSSQVFLESCSNPDQMRQIACITYIGGVTDSYVNSRQFCIPPGTRAEEIPKFTVDFILRNRQVQRESPVGMILLALKAKWPCINSGPQFRFEFRGF